MRKIILYIVFGMMIAVFLAYGANAGQAEDASKKLVNDAIAFAVEKGDLAAYMEITYKDRFKKDGMYVFVIAYNTFTLAHGGNPSLAGKRMLFPFVDEMIALAKTKGEGWVEYKFTNPETKQIQDKKSFIKKHPKKDIVFGCGIYK